MKIDSPSIKLPLHPADASHHRRHHFRRRKTRQRRHLRRGPAAQFSFRTTLSPGPSFFRQGQQKS